MATKVKALPTMKPRVECAAMEVNVRDIRVAADIGVFSHEMGIAQKLVVSARLVILPVAQDHLDQTIDYNVIVAYAEALGRERIALIETFAERLAQDCLRHAIVLSADIVVEKPGALANGVASTRIILHRDL